MDDINKRSASDVDPVTSLMQSLYQRAEAALGQRVSQSPEQFAALSPAQAQRTLHDLQVHQVELEMQNEELRRKQVELDESLARYVNFYDLAPVGYCTVTEEGLIREANLTTSTLLNVPRSELLKQSITRFIFNDDQDTYYKHRRKLIDADGPLSVELRLLKRDGAPFWAHLQVAKVKEGECGSEMRLVIKDISERKTVEESLRASEAQYRSLAEWTPESIIIHGAGKMLFVNPAAIKMLGATCASDLVGKPILDLIHPDFRKIVSQRLDKNAKPGGKSPMQEQKLFKCDGSVIDVEVQGMRVNFNGRPAVHAAMRDITERKKLEVERNRLLAIISEAPDFISIADMQGHLKYLNAAGAKMLGYAANIEVSALKIEDVAPKWAVKLVLEEGAPILMRQGFWQGESALLHRAGHEIPTSQVVLLHRDGSGIPQYTSTIIRDISDRKHSEELVRQLAYYDPLTGLVNRLLFNDQVTQATLASKRTGHHGALLLLDLDNFKSINDTYGHGAGDLLLIEVARRLKSCVREVDAVGRLGGDEFVVLLKDLAQDEVTAKAQVAVLAEKIRGLLGAPYVLTLAADADRAPQVIEHHCTASLGIALFLGTSVSREDCIKRADIAMYRAKNSGRNTVCFFNSLMQVEQTSNAIFEEDMRKAVFDKQFRLYYQAQVKNKSEVTGVEALLRWQHPTRGWLSPAEFIATAEKTGLILPLGLWVLETACTQLAVWANRAVTANLTMAVNVTARQFQQGDFVEQVIAVLERTGANPLLLKLELTESVLVTDVESIIVKMNLLKARGIGFSLDDFGTGYSSLSDLKRLPLSQLKIAQELVRDILIDPNDMGIARMVIALADSMGLTAIAEGVETEAQRDFLELLGCTRYQGFLFCSPVPIEAFEAFMKGS